MSNPGTLSPKQKRFLEMLVSFEAERGYSPSHHEIAKALGFRSVGTVQDYLERLSKKGLLKKGSFNAKRSLRVAKSTLKAPAVLAEKNTVRLPMAGRVAAGYPIEAVEARELLEVPSWMVRHGEHFVLRVTGSSMINEGIHDGDYVVLRKQSQAENGETVVALVDGEATIKRYRREGGRVVLEPANPAFQAITVRPEQDFKIAGVLRGILRRY